jgi:uncharacterized membrane protein
MDFEQVISAVVLVVEAVGAAVPSALRPGTRQSSYQGLRRNLGRAILLGLEVLIVADIIRTILVAPSVESVLVLGAIVLIRILLSFSLEVEMDGVWPWARWRLGAGKRAGADAD